MPGRSDAAGLSVAVGVGLERRGRVDGEVKMLSTVAVLALAVVTLHSSSALATSSHHINVIQHDADWQRRRAESFVPGLVTYRISH